MLWKRLRNVESGLVSMEKSSLMVMSNFVSGRCGWVLIPWMALRDVVWMFNARSTNALDCGWHVTIDVVSLVALTFKFVWEYWES